MRISGQTKEFLCIEFLKKQGQIIHGSQIFDKQGNPTKRQRDALSGRKCTVKNVPKNDDKWCLFLKTNYFYFVSQNPNPQSGVKTQN